MRPSTVFGKALGSSLRSIFVSRREAERTPSVGWRQSVMPIQSRWVWQRLWRAFCKFLVSQTLSLLVVLGVGQHILVACMSHGVEFGPALLSLTQYRRFTCSQICEHWITLLVIRRIILQYCHPLLPIHTIIIFQILYCARTNNLNITRIRWLVLKWVNRMFVFVGAIPLHILLFCLQSWLRNVCKYDTSRCVWRNGDCHKLW